MDPIRIYEINHPISDKQTHSSLSILVAWMNSISLFHAPDQRKELVIHFYTQPQSILEVKMITQS